MNDIEHYQLIVNKNHRSNKCLYSIVNEYKDFNLGYSFF